MGLASRIANCVARFYYSKVKVCLLIMPFLLFLKTKTHLRFLMVWSSSLIRPKWTTKIH